jgi:hypothetical protein
MITEKAWEYSRQAQEAQSITEAGVYSNMAFEELFENCQPTQSEFDKFADKLVLTSGAIWRLVLYIPLWHRASMDNTP